MRGGPERGGRGAWRRERPVSGPRTRAPPGCAPGLAPPDPRALPRRSRARSAPSCCCGGSPSVVLPGLRQALPRFGPRVGCVDEGTCAGRGVFGTAAVAGLRARGREAQGPRLPGVHGIGRAGGAAPRAARPAAAIEAVSADLPRGNAGPGVGRCGRRGDGRLLRGSWSACLKASFPLRRGTRRSAVQEAEQRSANVGRSRQVSGTKASGNTSALTTALPCPFDKGRNRAERACKPSPLRGGARAPRSCAVQGPVAA